MSRSTIITRLSPGREGIGSIFLPPVLRAAAGAFSPRRKGVRMGASLRLAGMGRRFKTLRRAIPALFLCLAQGLDGLPQGGAGAIIGETAAHGGAGSSRDAAGCRAQRGACHRVIAGGVTHG